MKKILLKTCYPLIIGLVFWGYFALIEDWWYGTIFWGIILIIVSIGLIPNIYFPNVKDKDRLGLILIGITFAIPILASMVYFAVLSFMDNKTFGLIILLLVVITIVLYLCLHWLLQKSTKFQLLATCRLAYRVLSVFTSLCLFLISFLGFKTIVDKEFLDTKYLFEGCPLTLSDIAIIGELVWVLISFLLLRYFTDDLHFLVYDKKEYLLYLRSFTFDKNENKVLSVLKEFKVPILKIGNPKTFSQGFYLPSANWKKHLGYYISRAKYVFSVVDITEGVLWEMFNHLEQSNKFVYYVSDIENLKQVVTKLPVKEYARTNLWYCINHILTVGNNEIAFCIKDGKLFYGNAYDILDFKINEHITNNIIVVESLFGESLLKPKNELLEQETFYNTMDAVRTTSFIGKHVFRISIDKTLIMIHIIIIIVFLLTAIGGLLSIIGIWTDIPKRFGLDFSSVYDLPIWMQWIPGCITFFIGIRGFFSLLKDLRGK